jgi:ribosomal protein S18 acetylase RimI-like enzyme
MTAVLREARAEDLPVICALGQEINLLHHDAWPQVYAPPSDPSRDAPHWQQSIGKLDATTFVAEQSGRVVAFITISLVTESNPLLQPMQVARVGSVCVSAQLRRQGIGRSLMAQAERWAHERGAGDIRLNVWAFNAEALRFYDELGFAVRSHFLGKVLSRAA